MCSPQCKLAASNQTTSPGHDPDEQQHFTRVEVMSVKASVNFCAGNFLQGLDERCHTQGHALVLVDRPDLVEGVRHLAVKAPVDFVLIPFEVLQVLDPLKEAHLQYTWASSSKARQGNPHLISKERAAGCGAREGGGCLYLAAGYG